LPPAETEQLVIDELNLAKVRSQFGAPLRGRAQDLAAQIRQAGFATSANQINLGFESISVPVFDYSKRLICALTVLGPTQVLAKIRKKVVGHLLSSAGRLSGQLGGV
jgi:DNA-binding IclR family transcriptional regulator